MITKYELMIIQSIIALIGFVLFYIIGNTPAMILSVLLSLTTIDYAQDLKNKWPGT